MGATELARLLHGANLILEKASTAVGLSRRAALALVIMSLDKETSSNQRLQTQFLDYHITTDASVQKDVSAAKSELLKAEYIRIVGKTSVFAVTDKGLGIVGKINETISLVIEDIGLTVSERDIIRSLVGLPPRTSSPIDNAPLNGAESTKRPSARVTSPAKRKVQ